MKPRERARSDGYTIDDLRPFLVGPEQHRLESLEQKLATPEALAESVGKVLPRATVISHGLGEELSSAMQPIMTTIIHDTVRKDSKRFADAIYPSIGPAIRKAVAANLQEFVDRLDEIIQRTMTVESFKWRVEAIRTGRPLAEVMLLHSLVYRVEHVFLMHRESALVLEHVAAKEVEQQDPDQISAMLAAINDFARDAFQQKEGGLSYFRIGDLTGLVEQGPRAALVAIVRGVANNDVEKGLAEALELIHARYSDLFAKFKGDVSVFAPAREELLGVIREEVVQKPKRHFFYWLFALCAVAFALILGIPWYLSIRRFDGYVEALRQEPGISIIEARGGRFRGFYVEGLRDPLATDPSSLIAPHRLRPEKVSLSFEPIYSLDPRLMEQRTQQMLAPPPSVSLHHSAGTLVVTGVAPSAWIERARILSGALPGVAAFDGTRLYEAEAIAGAREAATTLESIEFDFDYGSDRLTERHGKQLDTAAAAAKKLLDLAPRGGFDAQIEIIGRADPRGMPENNQAISERRAENVANELHARGVPPEKLIVRGLGETEPAGRRVSFIVQLVPKA